MYFLSRKVDKSLPGNAILDIGSIIVFRFSETDLFLLKLNVFHLKKVDVVFFDIGSFLPHKDKQVSDENK